MSPRLADTLLGVAVASAVVAASAVMAIAAHPRPAPLAVAEARPFRATCPACHWDLTIYRPDPLQAIDFGRAKKTATDEPPR
jgi:hypothetical protein